MDRPNPRADQVSTAKPARASCSASGRTASLVSPNPCASRIAGTRPPPGGVKNVASSETCWLPPGPSATAIRSARAVTGTGWRRTTTAATSAAAARPAVTASVPSLRPRLRLRKSMTGTVATRPG